MKTKTWIIAGIVSGVIVLIGLGWFVLDATIDRFTRLPGRPGRPGPAIPTTSLPVVSSTTSSPSSVPSSATTQSTLTSQPTGRPNTSSTTEAFQKTIVFASGSLTLEGTLCKPAGPGPFATIIYHHGGKEGVIGGAPEETCAALATAGLVGFAPIRRETLDFQGNLDDVAASLDYVKTLDYVDQKRLGLVGFSRGGLLSFMAAGSRSDLDLLVMLAPAPPQGNASLEELAKKVKIPVFIQVAENDLPSKLNGGENLVAQAKDYENVLRQAGQNVHLTITPPYQETGHLMYFEVGSYWPEIVTFLQDYLR